jgi:hypothetical protein
MDQNNAFFAWQVYRYEDGRSQVACQFQTPINLTAVKQRLIWHKKLKNALILLASMSESHSWYLLHEEVESRAEHVQNMTISNPGLRALCSVASCG